MIIVKALILLKRLRIHKWSFTENEVMMLLIKLNAHGISLANY